MSFPLSAWTSSLPPRAQMTSRTPVPRSTSPCPVPTIVHGAFFQWGFAAAGATNTPRTTPATTPTTTMRCLSITDLPSRASDRSWHEPFLPPRDRLGIYLPHDERAHDRTPGARRHPVQCAIAEPNLGGRATIEVDGLFNTECDHHLGEPVRRHPHGPSGPAAVHRHDDEAAGRPQPSIRAAVGKAHGSSRVSHARQRTTYLGPSTPMVHQHGLTAECLVHRGARGDRPKSGTRPADSHVAST